MLSFSRTKKKTAGSGLADKISLQLPDSWRALSERQLRYVYWLYANKYNEDALLQMCVIRWCGWRDITRHDSTHFLVRMGDKRFLLLDLQLAMLTTYLQYLLNLPDFPVNIPRIHGHDSVAVDFRGVPFETYLMVTNLYTGYLHTKSDDLLSQLGTVLYGSDRMRFAPEELVSIAFWMGALLKMFTWRFPHFYSGGGGGSSEDIAKSLQAGMDAQLRALTKGDITKERQVLDMDTWRALTELDALAKEYEELKKKYPTKK